MALVGGAEEVDARFEWLRKYAPATFVLLSKVLNAKAALKLRPKYEDPWRSMMLSKLDQVWIVGGLYGILLNIPSSDTEKGKAIDAAVVAADNGDTVEGVRALHLWAYTGKFSETGATFLT